MDAMATPGRVQTIAAVAGAPPPMMLGTAALALTLFDHDTPIWLDPGMSEIPGYREVAQVSYRRADRPGVAVCSFALIANAEDLPVLERFSFGSNEYPDRSTTLVVQVESLARGQGYELRGPGIDGRTLLRAMIKPTDLFERLAVNAALFPREIDVVMVHDDAIVAIPRTTRLVAKED